MSKENELVTIPWNCPVCNSCRLIVKGYYGCAGPKQCVAGGPYTGYVEFADDRVEPVDPNSTRR